VTLSAKHHPTDDYIHQLRLKLPKQFPGVSFAFLPADMTSQILNFGLPAPNRCAGCGKRLGGKPALRKCAPRQIEIRHKEQQTCGSSAFDQPYLRLRVERTKAEQLGFTAHDIAQNLLVSLSGSFQTSPHSGLTPRIG